MDRRLFLSIGLLGITSCSRRELALDGREVLVRELPHIPPVNGIVARANGFARAGDGGGGMFRWVEGLNSEEDKGTVIGSIKAPGTGRWVREIGTERNVKVGWFDPELPASDRLEYALHALSTLGLDGVVLEENHNYLITREWLFEGLSGFELNGMNSTLTFEDTTPIGFGFSALRFDECRSFTCKKFQIDGNRNNRQFGEEPGHLVYLRGCSDFEFEDVHCQNATTDSFYITARNPTDRSTFCRDGKFTHCSSDNAARQGMSVIEVARLQLKNCRFAGSNGILPMSGVDLEPNEASPEESCTEILVDACEFDMNEGYGLTMGHKVRKVRVINSTFSRSTHGALKAGGVDDLEVRNCEFRQFPESARGVIDISTGSTIIISNNRMLDISTPSPSIYVHESVTGAEIVDNQLVGGGAATSIVSYAKSTRISGNEIDDAFSNGIDVLGSNSLVSSNIIRRPGDRGVYVGGEQCTVSDNTIENVQHRSIVGAGAIQVDARTGRVEGNTITRSQNSGGSGYAIRATPGIVVANNKSRRYEKELERRPNQ